MILKLLDDRREVLGVSLGGLWIGNSESEMQAPGGAVLNVAQDLPSYRGWPSTEAMHVGLIDGPGNEISAYCAAVLALDALLHRHNVLVHCHTGGRSLAVVLLYLCATSDRSWVSWLGALEERVDSELPPVNRIHQDVIPEVLRRLSWLRKS